MLTRVETILFDLCVTNKDLKISHKQLVLVNGAPILRKPLFYFYQEW